MMNTSLGRPGHIRLFSAILVCISLIIFTYDAVAQSPFEMRDLSTIRSVNISNTQLQRFIEQGRAQGMTVTETMQMARQRGLPASEAEILLRRIRELELEQQRQELDERRLTDPEEPDYDTIVQPEDVLDEIGRRIFGARLFRQEGITFEPSMNVPTPVNYQLGPGDEIIVDIWGEATNVHRLEVEQPGNRDNRKSGTNLCAWIKYGRGIRTDN
jgi:hypothetical protein